MVNNEFSFHQSLLPPSPAMVLPSPSKEVMNGVRAALGLDEAGMRQAVQLVKEWLKHQAHLPHEIGK